MLKKLTKEQEAMLPVWCDKWIEIGLSCEPCDFEASKIAAAKAYKAAGLEPPKQFYLFDSPVSAAVGIERLSTGASLVDYHFIPGAFVKLADKDTGPLMRPQEIVAAGGGKVKARVQEMLYGSHSAGWLSFYDFFLTVCKLECVEPLRGLIDLAKVCGWWSPYDEVAVFQHRHSELHFDPQGRLHSESDMAVKYRDGFGVYAWHGTIIPEEWIKEREKMDPKIALTWPHVEQRRAAAEIMGWLRVLEGLPHRVIQMDKDPQIGTLFSVDLPDAPDSRFLKVHCPTGRDFVLAVPKEAKTAREANAMSYGLSGKEYDLEVRT